MDLGRRGILRGAVLWEGALAAANKTEDEVEGRPEFANILSFTYLRIPAMPLSRS